MTGQIAFSKTLRALDADDFRASKLSVALALVTLAGWIWWMLTASVAQYEELPGYASVGWDASSHRALIRDLPLGAFARIRDGQTIQLRFDVRSVDARVAGKYFWLVGNPVEAVRLEVPSTMAPPLPSRARIAIEVNISPARIVLRSLHQ